MEKNDLTFLPGGIGAMKIQVRRTVFPGSPTPWIGVGEYQATKSRRRGRREESTATNYTPTHHSVLVPMSMAPAFRAALEQIEAEAVERGEITAADYVTAGLPVPDVLRGVA